MPANVIHIIKHTATQERYFYHGSTKDILGRREYFEARGIHHVEIAPERHTDGKLFGVIGSKSFALRTDAMDNVDAIVIEYPRFPGSIVKLRYQFPGARIYVRSHNAELQHQFHNIAAEFQIGPHGDRSVDRLKRHLGRAWRQGMGDWRCARLADGILAICDWEAEHYWSWMAPRHKIFTVPYFLPHYYQESRPAKAVRKPICVCLSSAAPGPMTLAAVRNFIDIVQQANVTGWRFQITGDVPEDLIPPGSPIERLGFVPDPLAVLEEATCTALMSDLGMGFKTKVLDAARMGCYTLMPPKLFSRQPDEVKPFCLMVKPGDAQAFRNALERSLEPPPETDVNAALRQRAYAVLDQIIYS